LNGFNSADTLEAGRASSQNCSRTPVKVQLGTLIGASDILSKVVNDVKYGRFSHSFDNEAEVLRHKKLFSMQLPLLDNGGRFAYAASFA